MDRIISPEERMRRAEEIYYRRRAQGVRVSTSTVNLGKNSNKISLKKKMIIQILVCVSIYTAFWMIKDYNNIFSYNVLKQTRDVLNYDINIKKIYNNIEEYFNTNFNSIIKKDDELENSNEKKDAEETTEEKADDLNNENSQVNNEQDTNDTEVIEQNTEVIEQNTDNSIENDGTIKAKSDAENITQMEQDAEYIKLNYSIIKPIEGYITSRFGDREETEIVSAFHQGVDIGATSGTAIQAAMEGEVVAASYAGDYGNHIKIQNGDVLTVYAHCSELEVNVGEHISQGQEIAKVGATGKVTGPHLHFEIRREGRYINPEMILTF